VVRDVQSALAADALSTTHPITQPVDSPNSIRSIYDAITYEKGNYTARLFYFSVWIQINFRFGMQLLTINTGMKLLQINPFTPYVMSLLSWITNASNRNIVFKHNLYQLNLI
jgi:hypothetical protein